MISLSKFRVLVVAETVLRFTRLQIRGEERIVRRMYVWSTTNGWSTDLIFNALCASARSSATLTPLWLGWAPWQSVTTCTICGRHIVFKENYLFYTVRVHR